jgi:hypothetical protein
MNDINSSKQLDTQKYRLFKVFDQTYLNDYNRKLSDFMGDIVVENFSPNRRNDSLYFAFIIDDIKIINPFTQRVSLTPDPYISETYTVKFKDALVYRKLAEQYERELQLYKTVESYLTIGFLNYRFSVLDIAVLSPSCITELLEWPLHELSTSKVSKQLQIAFLESTATLVEKIKENLFFVDLSFKG